MSKLVFAPGFNVNEYERQSLGPLFFGTLPVATLSITFPEPSTNSISIVGSPPLLPVPKRLNASNETVIGVFGITSRFLLAYIIPPTPATPPTLIAKNLPFGKPVWSTGLTQPGCVTKFVTEYSPSSIIEDV